MNRAAVFPGAGLSPAAAARLDLVLAPVSGAAVADVFGARSSLLVAEPSP